MRIAESFRHCEGNNNIVRLFQWPYDSKWIQTTDKKMKYLVIRYTSDKDKYIPIKGKNKKYWDTATYDELNLGKIGTTKEKALSRMNEARTNIKTSVGKNKFYTDDFSIAQDKYIDWCLTYCGVIKTKWTAVSMGD